MKKLIFLLILKINSMKKECFFNKTTFEEINKNPQLLEISKNIKKNFTEILSNFIIIQEEEYLIKIKKINEFLQNLFNTLINKKEINMSETNNFLFYEISSLKEKITLDTITFLKYNICYIDKLSKEFNVIEELKRKELKYQSVEDNFKVINNHLEDLNKFVKFINKE